MKALPLGSLTLLLNDFRTFYHSHWQSRLLHLHSPSLRVTQSASGRLAIMLAGSASAIVLLLYYLQFFTGTSASDCILAPSLSRCYNDSDQHRPLHAMYKTALAVTSSAVRGSDVLAGDVDSGGGGGGSSAGSDTTTTGSGTTSGTTAGIGTSAFLDRGSLAVAPALQQPVTTADPSRNWAIQIAAIRTSVTSGCRLTSSPGMRLQGRRFLMLAQTWEQLSQTRLHVLEAMALAKLTGRTLVLTHVGNSTLLYREQLPFCSYFDTDLLGEAVPWVTQDWLEGEIIMMRREEYNLTTHTLLLVHEVAGMPCDGTQWVHYDRVGGIYTQDVDEEGQKRVDCVFIPATGTTRRMREALLMGAATKLDVREADLLLLQRRTHRYYLGLDKIQAFHGLLQYAPYLHHLADSFISHHLSPDYIAIHWRIEWTRMMHWSKTALDTQELYDDCWSSLVQAVKHGPHGVLADSSDMAAKEYQKQSSDGAPGSGSIDSSAGSGSGNVSGSGGSRNGQRKVFLAADISPGEFLSTTMTTTMDGEAAVIARQALQKLMGSLEIVTWPTHEPWFQEIESGVKGILDKLVAMKAGFFLGAPWECGGGHTFTEEIHSWRAERRLPSDTWVLGKE